MAEPTGDERVAELQAEAERLQAVAEELVPPVETASSREATTATALESAEAALKQAEQTMSQASSSAGSAAKENSEARQRVAALLESVLESRVLLRKLGGSGVGTSEANPPNLDELPGPDDGSSAAQKSAVEKLQPRELDEVRKLSRPPEIVRRALELVRELLKLNDGGDLDEKAKEVEWSELQAMIAASGFVKRVVSMKPLALSRKPEQLQSIAARWPGLLDAVGKSAAPRKTAAAFKAAGESRASTSNLKSKLLLAAAQAKEQSEAEAPAAEGPMGVPMGLAAAPAKKAGSRLADAIKAAQAEAKPDGKALTVEAVEYASRPCGAIFRWCATVMSNAVRIHQERVAAQQRLDEELAKLEKERTALSATDEHNAKLTGEEAALEAQRAAAQEARDKAKEAHVLAMMQHTDAKAALDAARKAAKEAAHRAKQGAEAEKRRKEDAERRRRDKAESERLAQAAIDADLANRDKKQPVNKLVWIFEHKLPMIKPLEFGENAATLPADAPVSLAKVAKEMQDAPSLKLHIAGHIAADEEEAKLSSQRAQAVGAALIAMGAMPSRLRAKGYGKSVALSAAMLARLKLKSERRVGLHAISEVGTQYPLEFAQRSHEVSEKGVLLLREIAALMTENPEMRISIEGHTDDVGDPQENAKLSVARAQATSRVLQVNGVDASRLVAHGFGSTLPLSDNADDEGRARNRRVQFLVIPDVKPTQT